MRYVVPAVSDTSMFVALEQSFSGPNEVRQISGTCVYVPQAPPVKPSSTADVREPQNENW